MLEFVLNNDIFILLIDSYIFMKTAIIVATYNFKKWINEFFEKITPILEKRDDIELLIIENNSKDETASILKALLLDDVENKTEKEKWIDTKLKNTKIYFSNENLYFAEGNNVGFKKSLEDNCKYSFLLNQDAFLINGGLEKLEGYLDVNINTGSLQPIILVKENNRINASGVSLNYLHIGYDRDFNKDYKQENYKTGENINYGMGAAILVRNSILEQTGLFPKEYEMYHEDSFLQLRMKYLGYKVELFNEPLVSHDYKFEASAGFNKYYFTERNRLWNIVCFYKIPTIIAIFPMFFIMELGMILYSITSGWFKLKIKSYLDFLKGLKKILKYRKEIQKTRKIKDRTLILEMTDKVYTDNIKNPLFNIVANNLLWIYYKFLLLIIWW